MPCYMQKNSNGTTFVCGDFGEHCYKCGWFADCLCDYPVGENKTCDRKMCGSHSNEVAHEMHYCAAHFDMWQNYKDSGGVERELAKVVPFRASKK